MPTFSPQLTQQACHEQATAGLTATENPPGPSWLTLGPKPGANPTNIETPQSSLITRGPFNPAAMLPPKLVKRILELEFVEMAELTVDAWEDSSSPAPDTSVVGRRPSRRAPITDINIWLECYARLAALLSTRFPDKAPELWAYQSTIVRAARNYEGGAWVAYDRQYRREALANKNLDWSVPNHRLYNEAFTGRAKSIPRCHICLSDTHPTHQCPSNPNLLTGFGWQDTRLAPTAQWHTRSTPPNRPEICRNYNENRCFHPKCRYIHVCLECSYPHPYASCPRNPMSQTSRPVGRSRSPTRRSRLPPRPQVQPSYPWQQP